MKRRARGLDAAALRNLTVATAVLAAAIAVVKTASAFSLGMPVRWLWGGMGVFAFAEMATTGLALVTAALGLAVPPLIDPNYGLTLFLKKP